MPNTKKSRRTPKRSKAAYCKAHNKRRFPDKKSADKSIRAFANNMKLGTFNQNHTIPVRSYFCIHCKGFHLTSKPGTQTDA